MSEQTCFKTLCISINIAPVQKWIIVCIWSEAIPKFRFEENQLQKLKKGKKEKKTTTKKMKNESNENEQTHGSIGILARVYCKFVWIVDNSRFMIGLIFFGENFRMEISDMFNKWINYRFHFVFEPVNSFIIFLLPRIGFLNNYSFTYLIGAFPPLFIFQNEEERFSVLVVLPFY